MLNWTEAHDGGKMLPMDASNLVTNGFFFALDLMGSLGIKFDSDGRQFSSDELMQRLRGIACGDVSVYGSPDEEIAEAEENRGGHPATPEELAYFRSAFADRKGHDMRNQQ